MFVITCDAKQEPSVMADAYSALPSVQEMKRETYTKKCLTPELPQKPQRRFIVDKVKKENYTEKIEHLKELMNLNKKPKEVPRLGKNFVVRNIQTVYAKVERYNKMFKEINPPARIMNPQINDFEDTKKLYTKIFEEFPLKAQTSRQKLH